MAQNQDAQALGQLAEILADYASQGQGGPVSPVEVVQRGVAIAKESGDACEDGMLLRSGFCKRFSGGKRRRKMKGGACTRKLSKTLAALLITLEITGTSAMIYALAPAEISGLVFACYGAIQSTFRGLLAGITASVELRDVNIIAKLWEIATNFYGKAGGISLVTIPFRRLIGSHYVTLCNAIENWLDNEGVGAVAAAGVDATATDDSDSSSSGGARRRRTYKKRGGARRGGARGSSCGMSGGRKRKTRGGRKSRGRKSRGRKSRVHKKKRGRKSRKH